MTVPGTPVKDADHVAMDISLTQEGDAEAFGRLVDTFSENIHRQMRHYSRDATVCEELAQEVFVEAYFSVKTYTFGAPFGHWLSRIASRVGYKHWRNKKREPVTVPIGDWDAAVSGGIDRLENSEAAEMLYGLLARLSVKDRMLLTMQYFEGLDSIEAAVRMGWSRSMTRVNTYRAKKRLRQLAESAGLLEGLL